MKNDPVLVNEPVLESNSKGFMVSSAPKEVFLGQFVTGFGCGGSEIEKELIFSSPLSRIELENFRTLVEKKRKEFLVEKSPPPLLAPKWDASFYGTKREYNALYAQYQKESKERNEKEKEILTGFEKSLFSLAGVLSYVPKSSWFGVRIGDEDDYADYTLNDNYPKTLATATEKGCRCAHIGFYGDEDPEVMMQKSFLYEVDKRLFLTTEEKNVPLLLQKVKEQVVTLSKKYEEERQNVNLFQLLSTEEELSLTFLETKDYLEKKKEHNDLSTRHFSKTVVEFEEYTTRKELVTNGIFELALHTGPLNRGSLYF